MTSKEYLSQEEIDALLNKSDDQSSANPDPVVNDFLTELEIDALGEIGNITFGSAATALSTLLGRKVDITTPRLKLIEKENLEQEFPRPHVAVHVHYVDGFEGINSLVIKTSDAQVIADLMLGGDGKNVADELNEIHISAVQEAMNQMMGSSATSMSTIFNRLVNISPPGIGILNAESGEGIDILPPENMLIKVSFRLMIGDLIDSTIMQILTIPFAKEMVARLLNTSEMDVTQVEEQPTQQAQNYSTPAPSADFGMGTAATPPMHPNGAGYAMEQTPYPTAPNQHMHMQQPMNMPMGQVPQGNPYGAPGSFGMAPNRQVNVQPVQFANLQATPYQMGDDSNLNLLLDIPLRVTVELGRTHKQIKDILELSQGSIIELDKLAGEPVDILVNNKLIAKGEVVVIDENFGVRVTDIINQWDRIQKLQ
ncbi:flagellar motor switch phosphatase FliY [Paenibacillus sp. SC116]|uniref:flagellar motor switch phosphatase FliY n=1 Tax=Paenibacillus sp. SC116 TaxID=2968986 RepID=UPI00215A4F9A|nr:flagellar motor switch phosphatase FliY [Paenibacillus sp. SC116]MCR8845458.1 flagellar motor switch phosphatase FliY [Paenibacillus sp. SC116]